MISKKLCTFAAKADFPVHILRIPHYHLTDKLLNCEEFLTEPGNQGSNRPGDPGKTQRHLVLAIIPAARLPTVTTRGNLGSPAKPTCIDFSRRPRCFNKIHSDIGGTCIKPGPSCYEATVLTTAPTRLYGGKAHSSTLNCSFHLYKIPSTITTCCGFMKPLFRDVSWLRLLLSLGPRKRCPKCSSISKIHCRCW